MLRYYAIFQQIKDEWDVSFPDIDAVHTSGKDVDEAFDLATDALSAILVYGRKGREYKKPCSRSRRSQNFTTGIEPILDNAYLRG